MTFQQFAYRNVIRNSRVYAAFFMASIFSVMVFFIYSMLMFHPNIEDQFLQDIAFSGMLVAEIILIIFTLFFLFYSMSAFLQARSKEFGTITKLRNGSGTNGSSYFHRDDDLGVYLHYSWYFFWILFFEIFLYGYSGNVFIG